MRTRLILGVWIAAAVVLVRPGEAQVTRADTAAVLYQVADDLRSAGRVEDARRLLSIILERYGQTAAAGAARELLETLRSATDPGRGTGEFVAWHTLLGATVGLLVPAALDANDPEPYGVGMLVGGPLGYALSRAYAGRAELSNGQALAIDYAGLWGLIQVPMWEAILDVGAETRCFDSGAQQICFEEGGDGSPAGALVGALAGVAVGIAVAGRRPVTSATALSMIFASQWGLYFGFVGSTLAQAEGDGALAWTALGGNAGLIAAAVAAPRLGWTPGRVWLVQASGLAGLAAGVGVALLVDPSDDEAAWALTGIGAGIGLVIGAAGSATLEASGREPALRGFSLVERREDRWRLGLPLPRPGLVPAPSGHSRAFVPALTLSIVHAVF